MRIPLLAVVTQNVASLVAKASQIGLTITVLGEIRFGILNGRKKQKYTELLDNFLSNVRVEVLDITNTTAKLYGEIATQLRQVGRSIRPNDIWIAALCKEHGYKLATNDDGFEDILGLEIAKT